MREESRYVYKVKEKRKEFYKNVWIFVLAEIVCIWLVINYTGKGEGRDFLEALALLIAFTIILSLFWTSQFRRGLFVWPERKECLYVPTIGKKRHFFFSDIAKVDYSEPGNGIDSKEIVGRSKTKKKLFVITGYMENVDRFLKDLYADNSEYITHYDSITFDELLGIAFEELNSYIDGKIEMPFYMNRKMLEKIRYELAVMNKVRNREKFSPSYEAVIETLWDYRNKLGHDLMNVAEIYRAEFAFELPYDATQRDYERAKTIITEICNLKKIKCSNDTISSVTIELMNRLSAKGKGYSAEEVWEIGRKSIKNSEGLGEDK